MPSGCWGTTAVKCGKNGTKFTTSNYLKQSKDRTYIKKGTCQQCSRSIDVYEYHLVFKCSECNWTRTTTGGANLCSLTCAKNYYVGVGLICEGYYYKCPYSAGTTTYSRKYTTYKCNGCGASTTYFEAASYGTCTRCGSNHSKAAEGSKTTSHKAVAKYLICGK